MKVPAGPQEETISKAKQSRSEKKARKALSKLGLQQSLLSVSLCVFSVYVYVMCMSMDLSYLK